MLMYLNIPVWMTVDGRGWAERVTGSPPYIVTALEPSLRDGFFPFEYICPDSPVPVTGWRCDEQFQIMYRNNPNRDLMFTYLGQVIDAKQYDLLMKYYDRKVKDQVESLLSSLSWDSVKVEQQAQFMQGVRVAKTIPLLGLKICLDAYDFDDFWANVDWRNPMTYFNCIKEVIGIASSGVSLYKSVK